jgi:lipopolysaccharide/colanic/teichoic acid biosynthesis glycosyltransferase
MHGLYDHRPLVLPIDDGRAGDVRPWYGSCKALADAVLAALMLVLAAPLILLLMALVKLTSRGPALHTQVRLGRGGRPYTMYKIRTMPHNCERESGPCWAIPEDPRATRLGRFLRRHHLDELPQFWNVLRGEMSLVGPRPERPEIVAQLERAVPGYRDRLRVRPGITGLAQVLLPADVHLGGVRRKVACDLCYIDRMRPWLDARIVVGTVLTLAGVPPGVTRCLLQLPGVEEGASAHWGDDARAGDLAPAEMI